MSVIKYKRGAKKQLSANFNQSEFDCKGNASTSRCGCTETLVNTRLIRKLQVLRVRTKKPVSINSAYRCPVHNRYVGGASNSYHTKGYAADIVVKGMTPQQVAKLAEEIGFTGVGMYNGTSGVFTHVDVRDTPYKWRNTAGKNIKVAGFGGIMQKCPYSLQSSTKKTGSTGDGVRAIQWIVNWAGYNCTVDGVFGEKTRNAVMKFQTDMSLASDGIVGSATRSALADVIS